MSEPTATTNVCLGFLTVFAEANGYLGGYLVTNSWGRPIEFRLSTAVQPNRVQQILYGHTLTEYLCAELIGKTLVEKTATPVQLLVTDSPDMLPIRSRVEVPVVGVVAESQRRSADSDRRLTTFEHPRSSVALALDSRWASDEGSVRRILDRLDAALDLAEPFARIREAMGEARKMGVTSRAA
ncbi:MAG TPA: hypothetical protein VKE40_23615 [Gemmataceae bacterium]|nr:hypothetical protein [Gemmataceae bacterium]